MEQQTYQELLAERDWLRTRVQFLEEENSRLRIRLGENIPVKPQGHLAMLTLSLQEKVDFLLVDGIARRQEKLDISRFVVMNGITYFATRKSTSVQTARTVSSQLFLMKIFTSICRAKMKMGVT